MSSLKNQLSLLYLIILFIFNAGITTGNPDSPDNKPERLEWLQDAGFGMFIHWSMDSQLGSVISHSMVGASDDYLDRYINVLPKTFNPKRLDMEEIAILAKLAGMQYIVFTTKHHSGFCMWDTKTTNFNIMNTPYQKDILVDYVKAVRDQGLGVGFYYSPEDFWYLHNQGIKITRRGPESNPEENPKYTEYISTQMRELMTNYGPVNVMFFDGQGANPLKKICWTLQPDILITRGVLNTPEQTLPGIPMQGVWEANLTMGTQWQYKPTNELYKTGTRLIEILIETRAKGGALLLNIGIKPNGELPIEQEERLREIALWHFVNGESIHDVRPWIVTNEGDIWFSKKKDANTLYAYITKMPDWIKGDRKSFLLKSVRATENTVMEVLGQSGKWIEYQPDTDAGTKWSQEKDGLHISAVRAQRLYNNSKWPNPVVLKITNVEPALVPPKVLTLRAIPEEKDKNTIVLEGSLENMGKAEKVQLGFQYRPYAGFVEELYNDTWLESKFIDLTQTGKFQIKLQDLEKTKTFQFRAVVKHPLITVYGDIKRFTIQ